jgi:hypothetical protein
MTQSAFSKSYALASRPILAFKHATLGTVDLLWNNLRHRERRAYCSWQRKPSIGLGRGKWDCLDWRVRITLA